MTRPTGANRVTRRYLAAIDRATGLATPWNPNDPARVLLHTPTPVSALAADAVHVYFASATTGEVLRADRATADVDQTWRVVVSRAGGTPGSVTTMAVTGGLVYLGGEFDAVSGTTFRADRRGARWRRWAPTARSAPGRRRSTAPNPARSIRSLLALGRTIYLGGDFTSVAAQFRPGFAAVDPGDGRAHAARDVRARRHAHLRPGHRRRPDLRGRRDVRGAARGRRQHPRHASHAVRPDRRRRAVERGLRGGPALRRARVRHRHGRADGAATRRGRRCSPTTRAWCTCPTTTAASSTTRRCPAIRPDPPTLAALATGNRVDVSWTRALDRRRALELHAVCGHGAGRDQPGLGGVPRHDELHDHRARRHLLPHRRGAQRRRRRARRRTKCAVQVGLLSRRRRRRGRCRSPPPAPRSTLTWGAAPTASAYVLEAGQSPGSANLGVVRAAEHDVARRLAAARRLLRARAGGQRLRHQSAVERGGHHARRQRGGARAAHRPHGGVSGNVVTLAWTPPTSGGTPAGYQVEAGTVPGGVIAAVDDRGTGTGRAWRTERHLLRARASFNAAGAGAATADVTVVVP